MNQSLHLSEESSENEEPKTKSASLAHRDSTIPDHDLDASYHDQDDDAFNNSETEDSSPIKKGRGKEKEYDQIEKYPDFITAKNKMETYTTYHFRYEKKSINQGDKSYYSCNNQHKCPKLMYLLKVNILIFTI